MLVSKMLHFKKKREHSNIFLKKYCLFQSPKATKVQALKVLKFSYDFSMVT